MGIKGTDRGRLDNFLCFCACICLGCGACASQPVQGERVRVVREAVMVPDAGPAIEQRGPLDLWIRDLDRSEVEADGSIMIQALVHDWTLLVNAYESCQIDIDAFNTYREFILKKREEILLELDGD